jgi:hypothetical protein
MRNRNAPKAVIDGSIHGEFATSPGPNHDSPGQRTMKLQTLELHGLGSGRKQDREIKNPAANLQKEELQMISTTSLRKSNPIRAKGRRRLWREASELSQQCTSVWEA